MQAQWLPRDELYLMSDALSLWFLTEAEQGREPWRWLRDIRGQSEPPPLFRERIEALREAGRLRDDDTALVSLYFSETPTSHEIND